MNLTNWYADHLGRHLNRRRAEAARLRDGGSPRDLLPAKREELRAEIAKAARQLGSIPESEPLDPLDLHNLQHLAAWHLAQLRTQEGEYEEKLTRVWRQLVVAWTWTVVLSALLVIVSLTLIAATFLCAGPL